MHPLETHQALAALHPMGRMGNVADVVDAILYLDGAVSPGRFFTSAEDKLPTTTWCRAPSAMLVGTHAQAVVLLRPWALACSGEDRRTPGPGCT